ncbi:M23 family metallopeptidase [Sphingomonas montanisoli]|uniref:M23 family metallopeptidase n=1 Tax=Sphingomonas montanisoli TaxID=2606412 RepID=A0A5D9C1T9_9SPHN|nr:M23 family metallopeptidase [Sphingomonas montanisoli]TZG25020.1 M23 family metallopeptidase [Sphingomonas montanisoli]
MPARTLSPLLPLTALLVTACIPGQQRGRAPVTRPPAEIQVPVVEPTPPPPPPPTSEGTPPSPPPAWQVKKVVANATNVADQTYLVKPGDNLRRISDTTGAASEAIARANNIAPPFKILAGQKLKIPGGRYHRVGKGETGIAISRAYGVEWARIAQLNDLEEPYVLREGMRLVLPSSGEVARMSPQDRADAFRLDIEDLITGSEPALAVREKAKPPAPTPKRVAPTVAVAEPTTFAGRFDWPVRGPILRSFGRIGDGQQNDGVNIGTPAGSAVAAAADGVVAYVGQDIPAYGTLILIRHGDGWLSAYGYAATITVTRGQKVVRGQMIARSGASPYTGEPQLHFEVRNGRKPVNPLSVLPGRS